MISCLSTKSTTNYANNVNAQRRRFPECIPKVSDPHHGGINEWTYHEGDFYHRAKIGSNNKWTKASKSHLTPARVVMFHELLLELNVVQLVAS